MSNMHSDNIEITMRSSIGLWKGKPRVNFGVEDLVNHPSECMNVVGCHPLGVNVFYSLTLVP